MPGGVAAASDADGLRVMSVLRQPGSDAVSVVAEVQPAPNGALPADAARVAVDGAAVPATTEPLLAPDAPTAVVLDASAEGGAALPQALSGAAAFLLRLPTNTPVTVTIDTTPPITLTPSPAHPVDAIHLLAGLRPAGARSTVAALDLALSGLRPSAAGRSLVLLQTTGSAPPAAEASRLSDRLRSAGAVLAVVTTPALAPGWRKVAEATGGSAVGSAPEASATRFDEVARMLRACSVVTFTPPAGATSARLRLRAGDAVLPAEVPLASAAAPSTGTAARASSSAGSTGPGRLLLVTAVALVLLALAASVLLRPRRRAGPAWRLDDEHLSVAAPAKENESPSRDQVAEDERRSRGSRGERGTGP